MKRKDIFGRTRYCICSDNESSRYRQCPWCRVLVYHGADSVRPRRWVRRSSRLATHPPRFVGKNRGTVARDSVALLADKKQDESIAIRGRSRRRFPGWAAASRHGARHEETFLRQSKHRPLLPPPCPTTGPVSPCFNPPGPTSSLPLCTVPGRPLGPSWSACKLFTENGGRRAQIAGLQVVPLWASARGRKEPRARPRSNGLTDDGGEARSARNRSDCFRPNLPP